MTDLEQLAERCEKASGPDRELDIEIAIASGLYVKEKRGSDRKEWFYPTDGKGWRHSPYSLGFERLPSFTASLDAAMTLVPEGYDWAVFRTNGGLTVHAWCGSREDVFSSTPALALCAAALRAIAANRK